MILTYLEKKSGESHWDSNWGSTACARTNAQDNGPVDTLHQWDSSPSCLQDKTSKKNQLPPYHHCHTRPKPKDLAPTNTKHKCELQTPSAQFGTQHGSVSELGDIHIQYLGKHSIGKAFQHIQWMTMNGMYPFMRREDVVITRNCLYEVLPSQDSLCSKSACERSVLLVPWPHLSNGWAIRLKNCWYIP